jgi:hypothetical protein
MQKIDSFGNSRFLLWPRGLCYVVIDEFIIREDTEP